MSKDGDIAQHFNALREDRREKRAKLGVACEGCVRDHPKRDPSILLPGQKCRWCGHRDVRAPEGRE